MYYAILIYTDRDYWKKAPNYFNYFLLVQYAILALTIRLPVMSSISSSSATKLTALLVLFLIANTTTGIIWLRELTEPSEDTPSKDSFNLKDKYIAHGVVLILVPLSVFLFLFIVLVKVLCFFIADPKHRRGRGESRSYGQF